MNYLESLMNYSEMNYSHIHILLNHFPSIGTLFGLVLLVYGVWKKDHKLQIVSFIVFMVMGLLAIPVLAGSASFAVSEVFGWRAGLDLRPRQGRRFYLVLAGAVAAGMVLDVFKMNAVRMLFLSAVLNGLLAPPLLVLVMLVGSNPRIMGEHVNPRWLNLLGWTATLLMGAAAVVLGISAVG